MLQDDIFKRLIVYKALMLVLIIIWVAPQMNNADNPDSNNLTDLGGLFFFISQWFTSIYVINFTRLNH